MKKPPKPPPRSGEANGRAKLTAKDVAEIRVLWDEVSHGEGISLIKSLAETYNCSEVNIKSIIYYRTWKFI